MTELPGSVYTLPAGSKSVADWAPDMIWRRTGTVGDVYDLPLIAKVSDEKSNEKARFIARSTPESPAVPG
jgi:hypothetical protein